MEGGYKEKRQTGNT